MKDERERVAKSLGVDATTTAGKAAVMRAILGSIDPPDSQPVECECGWAGTIGDCHMKRYSSNEDSWAHLSGRAGWHWTCLDCGAVVWRYYNVIN